MLLLATLASGRTTFTCSKAVVSAIAAAEKKLGKGGRILVRKSGTEPLIRVMAEGDDSDLVRSVVDQIIEAIPPQAA